MGERPAESLHYIGVSFYLTKKLFNFWRRNGYRPLYMKQEANEITGEHSIIMLHMLHYPSSTGNIKWSASMEKDFGER